MNAVFKKAILRIGLRMKGEADKAPDENMTVGGARKCFPSGTELLRMVDGQRFGQLQLDF